MKLKTMLKFFEVDPAVLEQRFMGVGISVTIFADDQQISEFSSNIVGSIDPQFMTLAIVADTLELTESDLNDSAWLIKKFTQNLSASILNYTANHMVSDASIKDAYKEVMMYARTMAMKIYEHRPIASKPRMSFGI